MLDCRVQRLPISDELLIGRWTRGRLRKCGGGHYQSRNGGERKSGKCGVAHGSSQMMLTGVDAYWSSVTVALGGAQVPFGSSAAPSAVASASR